MSDSELETAINKIRIALEEEGLIGSTGQAIASSKKKLLTTGSEKDDTTLEDTTRGDTPDDEPMQEAEKIHPLPT